MSKRFPGRKLSFIRLAILTAVLALMVGAGIVTWRSYSDTRAAAASPSGFSAYVDVTATPRYGFEQPVGEETKTVVLSFIVADPQDGCVPTWGSFYSLDAAASELDLDRRIARLRQLGGDVSVSFGGQSNQELSTSCTDSDRLQQAYATVVDRYQLSTIDLDVEGAALADRVGVARQAKAIAALQRARNSIGRPLSVWLTLPVTPTGLLTEGSGAVSEMLEAGVDLAGVNIMTMDYGASRDPGQSILQATTAAAEATHTQLGPLFAAAGQEMGAQTLWRRIGLTPMIGQNDVVADVFTMADAQGVRDFALAKGIGRLSMWSLNRDAECGPNYPNLTVVSDACSGVRQAGSHFTKVLSGGLVPTDPGSTTPVPVPVLSTAAPVVDDPSTSPYPIWSSDATYVQGDRVVWQGSVYESKWWTKNNVPNDPVSDGAQTPWKLIGPVLPGDRPVPDVVVPTGTYPGWAADVVYHKGDRVILEGHIFEAKWWVQSESPAAALEGSSGSAWLKLSNEEVSRILHGSPAK
ncbi:chitinase [Paenarthrobacter sp. RAF54_2]|uniref:chitinase n=1 Tax=Paenarthrobacter sp. RAF54_2 TaxID=3233061 RepID=UPI003F97E75D